jgi:hypothetical protein
MYLAATTTATRTGFLTFLRLGWSNSVETTPSRIPNTGKILNQDLLRFFNNKRLSGELFNSRNASWRSKGKEILRMDLEQNNIVGPQSS